MVCFAECFGSIQDPRADNARHDLVEVMFIAVAASVCGAGSCVDMTEFGLAKKPCFVRCYNWSMACPAMIRSHACSV